MNLLVRALQLHVPVLVRRRALAELFQATAAAFGVEAPPLAGLDAEARLERYARFSQALAGERLVNRLTGTQFNPLYYTGTIAFLLLLLVGLTGLYLFFFFQYGYDASYNAVARMESQFIARTVRAIHRYASGAVVIVTLLHAYRMLFLEKFRGPRWLAWLCRVAAFSSSLTRRARILRVVPAKKISTSGLALTL